jgi:hypothetical protein
VLVPYLVPCTPCFASDLVSCDDRNGWIIGTNEMVSAAGIESATTRLKVRCFAHRPQNLSCSVGGFAALNAHMAQRFEGRIVLMAGEAAAGRSRNHRDPRSDFRPT